MNTAITGQQLATQIRQRANQLGVPLHVFVRPLSPHTKNWLSQLAQAQQPKPHTVARVRALLDGETVPAPPPNGFQAPARRGEPRREPTVLVHHASVEETAPEPINRNPCVGCGVRADVHAEYGCRTFLNSRLP